MASTPKILEKMLKTGSTTTSTQRKGKDAKESHSAADEGVVRATSEEVSQAASEDLIRAEGTAATEPILAEPLAQQIVLQTKAKPVVDQPSGPSASSGDLQPSTATVIRKSLEDALDKMFEVYTAQHKGFVDSYNGVKSLIRVSSFYLTFCVSALPQPPSVESSLGIKSRLGTCHKALVGAAPSLLFSSVCADQNRACML